MSAGRQTALWMVLVCIVLLAIELMSTIFAAASIWRGNGYGFYMWNIFRLSKSSLQHEGKASPLGWPDHDNPRSLRSHKQSCGSSFGDSFTWGGEVKEDETWPHYLSELLGCEILNYGYGGYGLDQSVLRYERVRPSSELVFLGLNTVMLLRNHAASWTFYAGPTKRNMPYYQITKPLFLLEGDELKLVPRPSRPITNESVADHHKHDYYQQYWTRLTFPFTLSVGNAIWRTHIKGDVPQRNVWERNTARRSRELALSLTLQLRIAVNTNGQRLVVVLIPDFPEVGHAGPYESFKADLTAAAPEVCVVDPMSALHQLLKSQEKLTAPLGHYTASSNKAIARAVAAGLDACGISPAR